MEELKAQFSTHEHNGSDSQRVKSKSLKWVPVELPLDATTGFLIFPTCVGTPTGVVLDGSAVFDTSTNKLWIYNGGWKSSTFT